MGKLYDIVRDIEDFEYEIDEETGEILNANQLDALELEKDNKIEQLCLYIKNLKSDAAAYKAEKDSFAKKQKAAENKAESIKNYIAYILAGENFKTDRVTVSYRRSEQVECLDMSLVDDDYLRFKEPELDKTKIKKALKQGVEVNGCMLIEKQNMQIR